MISPCIVTCLNNRPRVSEIIFMCAERLRIPVIAGYTEECDRILIESKPNTQAVYCQNVPGKKWNRALLEFMKNPAYTHALIMGDDDSLSTIGYKVLLMNAIGHDYVGFKKNAYYDLATGRAMMHEYQYKCDKLIGAGRLISRRALEKCCYAQTILIRRDYNGLLKGQHATLHPSVAQYLIGYGYAKPEIDAGYIGLWPEAAKSGLDHFSEMRLVMYGFVPVAIPSDVIYMTDFKSDVNIWPYSILERKCTDIKSDDAVWFLSEQEKDYINSLKK